MTNAWTGPPRDVLGAPVPISQFVVRTEHAVVALQQAVVFPEGCRFGVEVAARRGSLAQDDWKAVLESQSRGFLRPGPAGADLVFSVRFPDGSTAAAVDGWQHPDSPPAHPVLIEVDSSTGSDDHSFQSDRHLWLWPLPPPGPFEFVIEWRRMGITPTSTVLDGALIAATAHQARPYWPETTD
jgi:hypothetical protein